MKGTDESLPRVDLLDPLIHHDPSDLHSCIKNPDSDFPKQMHPKSQNVYFINVGTVKILPTRLPNTQPPGQTTGKNPLLLIPQEDGIDWCITRLQAASFFS